MSTKYDSVLLKLNPTKLGRQIYCIVFLTGLKANLKINICNTICIHTLHFLLNLFNSLEKEKECLCSPIKYIHTHKHKSKEKEEAISVETKVSLVY